MLVGFILLVENAKSLDTPEPSSIAQAGAIKMANGVWDV